MAKFNQPATTKTVNREGRPAYAMTNRSKLVHQVLTSFVSEKKFYGDNTDEMKQTLQAVVREDPAFVSKLAVFARREFNMRSVSHVLVGFLAHIPEGKPYVRETVRGVTLRGDDATEILAFYLSEFGKPIPNSLRRGLKDVFAGFDAYTLAKYKGESDVVKMRDILRLCRPTPATGEQSALWKQLLDGTLPSPYTWETQLSANGNNKETWEALIASGKLPYMAMLRNCRNIVNAEPSNIGEVWKKLSDPESVRHSRQLPFRFLSAYKNLPDSAGSRAYAALEAAANASVANLPKFPGRTVIAVDVSGSMSNNVSAKSDVRCCEIGMLLGLIANRICEDAVFYEFNNVLTVNRLPAGNDLLSACIQNARASGGTYMSLPFEEMIKKGIRADRLILISDNECNYAGSKHTVQAYADEYRRTVNPDLWVHAIDLMGYGTQQFTPGHRNNFVAGWSEKVFDFILLAEQGEGTLEKRIAEYVWDRKALSA